MCVRAITLRTEKYNEFALKHNRFCVSINICSRPGNDSSGVLTACKKRQTLSSTSISKYVYDESAL